MRIVATVLLLALPVCQLDGQSVVASVERVVTVSGRGEAVFSVQVQAALGGSVASVVEALAPARIGPQDLAARSLSRSSSGDSFAQGFLFRTVQPAARYLETLAALRAMAAGRRDLLLTFRGNTQPVDADIEQARVEVLPELFRQTKARAEQMLIEAGYRPGSIVELNETIEPLAGGHRVRLSLAMRMARLGVALSPSSVSAVVTPPAAPYRIGPPVLKASFAVRSKTRSDLLVLLQPTGLTEAQLTKVEVEPDRFSQDRGRDPGPVTVRYYFTAPIAESDIRARLGRLPPAITSSAEVTFAAEPARVDSTALSAAARLRAALLARLLGGQLGDGVRVAEVAIAEPASRGIIFGDFTSVVIPAERFPNGVSLVSFRTLREPGPHPTVRYQFAIAMTAP